MMKKAGLCCFVVLCSIFIFSGCSGPVAISGGMIPGEEDSSVVGLYQLQPLDPLQISLLGIPEEKALDMIIDEQGKITLPYIDKPVTAAGKTTSELERDIQRIYTEGQIYRSITVNVLTSAKTYYMEGEVKRPQEYSINRRITLLQAIAAASGYTEYANKKNVTITRNGQVIKVNAKKLEEHPEWDIPVEAGDRIKVNRSFY
jgi:polysaccharide export outer membrane protein